MHIILNADNLSLLKYYGFILVFVKCSYENMDVLGIDDRVGLSFASSLQRLSTLLYDCLITQRSLIGVKFDNTYSLGKFFADIYSAIRFWEFSFRIYHLGEMVYLTTEL